VRGTWLPHFQTAVIYDIEDPSEAQNAKLLNFKEEYNLIFSDQIACRGRVRIETPIFAAMTRVKRQQAASTHVERR
jgi:hypothetical protein